MEMPFLQDKQERAGRGGVRKQEKKVNIKNSFKNNYKEDIMYLHMCLIRT